MEVNTLEAGLNSTPVMEVTLQDNATAMFSTRLSAILYLISYTPLASNELQPLRV